MSFEIVHIKTPIAAPAPLAAATPIAVAPPVKPKTDAAVLTRKVSAKATVVVPEQADNWGRVTAELHEFSTGVSGPLAYTSVEKGEGVLAGARTYLPWIGVAVSLCISGVGVAACLGWAGAQRNFVKAKSDHKPVSPASIAAVRAYYEAAQKEAEGNPLKQAAQRHVVLNHLTSSLARRGLCVEGELFLQDLKHAALPDDPIDAAGKRSASTMARLQGGSSIWAFDAIEPYEAVALNLHVKTLGESNLSQTARHLADIAQDKIDDAVSREVQRLLNRQLDGSHDG